MPSTKALNPHARPFVPGSSTKAPNPPIDQAAKIEVQQGPPLPVLDLPPEVVSTVVSFLNEPKDAFSCGLACKPFLQQLGHASLRLDLATSYAHPLSSAEASAYLAKVLFSLRKYTPGLSCLDLSNQAVEDRDVAELLRCLPHLRHLDLTGCKKLSQQLGEVFTTMVREYMQGQPGQQQQGQEQQQEEEQEALLPQNALDERRGALGGHRSTEPTAHAVHGDAAPLPQHLGPVLPQRRPRPLRVLSLQRCFQLTSGCLTTILRSALAGALPLTCLAASHLEMGRWPLPATTAASAAPATAQSPGGADAALDFQQLLASCFGPTGQVAGGAEGTDSAAAGGAVLAVAAPPGHPQPLPSLATPLQVLALNNCTRLTPLGLQAIAATCPRLQYLFLGGCALLPGASVPALEGLGGLPHDYIRLVPRVRDLVRSCLATPSKLTNAMAESVVGLAMAIALLPDLRALEVTFMPLQLVSCLRAVLAALCAQEGRTPVMMWDMAQAGNVGSALRALRDVQRAVAGCNTSSGAATGSHVGSAAAAPPDGFALALKCAAGCTSATRSTPLHFAAERGDVEGAAALLQLGAQVNAREAGGSTPLFLACEAGHRPVADLLLSHGADPMVSNAAGETPMYIAALRGHLPVVQSLLHYCQAAGIAWQDARLYGDSWTPLMAAAVADRHDMARCLLQAAGPAAGPLISAVNRYGQTALHIAARKGSLQLLRLLLQWGGCRVVLLPDTSGDTPLDVAKKNRHAEALAELQRVLMVS